jgi:hypothetical protein
MCVIKKGNKEVGYFEHKDGKLTKLKTEDKGIKALASKGIPSPKSVLELSTGAFLTQLVPITPKDANFTFHFVQSLKSLGYTCDLGGKH